MPFWTEVEVRASGLAICFSDLQVEPNICLWVFIRHATIPIGWCDLYGSEMVPNVLDFTSHRALCLLNKAKAEDTYIKLNRFEFSQVYVPSSFMS